MKYKYKGVKSHLFMLSAPPPPGDKHPIKQGFPKSSKRWGVKKFCCRGFFYQVVGSWGGVILSIQTIFKAALCEYWTAIKIKISMTCVSKEYDIKTKMVQGQWLKVKMFLLGYKLKNFI